MTPARRWERWIGRLARGYPTALCSAERNRRRLYRRSDRGGDDESDGAGRGDLAQSLRFLESDLDVETVHRAGVVAATAAGVAIAVSSCLLGSVLPGLFVGSAAALAIGTAVRRAPVWVATVRRTRALGEMPAVVARIALRLRLEPSPERATRFAARTGEGSLSGSLDRHARTAEGSARAGLESFAREWERWFPEIPRAVALLRTSAASPATEREQNLDRAIAVVLDATRDRMATFAGEIRSPASGVYAFGVVLPLALVGMLPAARVAGAQVSVWHVVIAYDVVLPAALIAASGWLLLRRPVAFPPPRIDRSHPDVPDSPAGPVAAAVGVGVGSWLLSAGILPAWTGPLAAVGGGVGAGLLVHYRPAKDVHERVRDVETALDDAMYLVGRRVEAGTSVERAIEDAGAEIPGATGDVLEDGAGIQRRVRVGVREAFLGEFGALSTLPSPRARTATTFLSIAASEGRPAGSTLVALGEQLAELRKIERTSRRELATVTGTIANTGALFGPLVAGATVAMAGRMSGAEETAAGVGAALPTPELGLTVGVYVLLLAAVLTALAAGLERGLDRVVVGYRVGLALPSATATYLVAYTVTAMLL